MFGRHDVSGIQAHTDGAAASGAHAMGAQAFATGNHVAFAGTPDLHTAAHEMAHVVQQRGGVHLKGGIGQAGDSYEQHADQVADAVVQGKRAEALLDQQAGGSSGTAEAAVQRQPNEAKNDEDPDANVSLGILDNLFVGAGAEQVLGTTGWTVMREMLRGMRGGFQSMPADQRARIEAKAKNLGARELVQYAEGYGLGILEGLGLGLKGLGDAVVTLVTLPGEVNRFVFETVPDLAVTYGPRLMLAMNEANGLSGRLTSALADVLSHPAQLGELIEVFKGIALVKVRAMGHGLAGKIVDLVAEPWYDYGHDVGKIVGQILFEVLLAVASDAIANLVKEVLSVIGRLMAQLIEGAVEVFRTLRRLFGDALAWLGKLAGRMTGTLAEAFKDAERFIARLGTIFEDLAGERALADTGTGFYVPIPDPKGSTVLESRAVKPPGGGNTKAPDLTHPSKPPSGAVAKPTATLDEASFVKHARAAERATAERVAARPEFNGRSFRAPPPPDPGFDWIDDLGRKYDAMGDGTKAKYLNLEEFKESIVHHLRKGNDFTVIDLTGFEPNQIAAVRAYVDTLANSTIIRVGF